MVKYRADYFVTRIGTPVGSADLYHNSLYVFYRRHIEVTMNKLSLHKSEPTTRRIAF